MVFDEGLATALTATPKAFMPGTWLPVSMGTCLPCGYSGDHAHMDRLESKFYISSGTPDKASFTLLMRIAGHKQMWRIYALDWNPTSPHMNPIKPGSEYSGKLFLPGETHEHHFSKRVQDGNPCGFAVPVTADLKDFSAALTYFCDRVKVIRPPFSPEPPAQGQLL